MHRYCRVTFVVSKKQAYIALYFDIKGTNRAATGLTSDAVIVYSFAHSRLRPAVGYVLLWVTSCCGLRPAVGCVLLWVASCRGLRPAVGCVLLWVAILMFNEIRFSVLLFIWSYIYAYQSSLLNRRPMLVVVSGFHLFFGS